MLNYMHNTKLKISKWRFSSYINLSSICSRCFVLLLAGWVVIPVEVLTFHISRWYRAKYFAIMDFRFHKESAYISLIKWILWTPKMYKLYEYVEHEPPSLPSAFRTMSVLENGKQFSVFRGSWSNNYLFHSSSIEAFLMMFEFDFQSEPNVYGFFFCLVFIVTLTLEIIKNCCEANRSE